MRIWTLHPRYLDTKGLLALWRETLLAQKVLCGETRGYRHHPQLWRFQAASEPLAAIASYLVVVHEEAQRRGYHFDAAKIGPARFAGTLEETAGQLLYEWSHLKKKLETRAPQLLAARQGIAAPDAHPLFCIVAGGVQHWERA
jgi:hypothetical protein